MAVRPQRQRLLAEFVPADVPEIVPANVPGSWHEFRHVPWHESWHTFAESPGIVAASAAQPARREL